VRAIWQRWWPALLLMGIIFTVSSFSSFPGPQEPLLDRLFKKGAHFVGYGLLALSYLRGLRQSGLRHARPLAFIMVLLYAISDEWHQTFVPGRDGNVIDVGIDSAGAALALGWQQWWSQRSHAATALLRQERGR